MNMKEFFSEPSPRASELERARMRKVLGGVAKSPPRLESDRHSDALFAELRAVRSELANLREAVHAQAPSGDEVLTRRQAADLLCVCIETITKLARDEGLPCKRVGKDYRFLRSQIMAWLAARDEAQLSGEG